jgi:serine phosphatase RsbU (regulator of sigma subunit)
VVALASVALAGGLGWVIVADLRSDLGMALARDNAQRTQQRTDAELGREIALAQRLADSTVTREWLEDDNDPVKKARFVREAEGFRRAFAGHGYFAVAANTLHYYYADERRAPEPELGYTVSAAEPENVWYFTALARPDGVAVNVDHNAHFAVTNVWINITARDDTGRVYGVVGTGIELKHFLADVLASPDAGVVTMMVNDDGVIIAHPDTSRMAYDGASRAATDKTIYWMAGDSAAAEALRADLARVRNEPGQVATRVLTIDGSTHAVAMTYVKALRASVVTLVDPKAVAALRSGPVLTVALSATAVLILALLGAVFGFDRLVLRPLGELTGSVRRLARGDYLGRPLSSRQDEIGELERAFDDMAKRVHAHSEHLEGLVAERTSALAEANRQIVDTHRALTDSIDYAGLIQKSVLPGRGEPGRLPAGCAVLWRPRDVLGGDFYLYYRRDDAVVFGVADCAGHGVPGACMTMLGHGALQVALSDTPWDDPAAVLTRVDQLMREALPDGGARGAPATNMDLGLVFADLARGRVVFAGARLDLFVAEPGRCDRIPGGRRSLNDRRAGRFGNTVLDLGTNRTFLLTTDGLLDQAGGAEGFGFGAERFAAFAASNAALPIQDMGVALEKTFDDYRGAVGQRDDVTVLAFRLDAMRPPAEPDKERR